MSCACENKRLSGELDRIRRLAKAYARMEGVSVYIFRREDGTYGYDRTDCETENQIVEYISRY